MTASLTFKGKCLGGLTVTANISPCLAITLYYYLSSIIYLIKDRGEISGGIRACQILGRNLFRIDFPIFIHMVNLESSSNSCFLINLADLSQMKANAAATSKAPVPPASVPC